MKLSYPAPDTLRCVQTRCFGTAVFGLLALMFFAASAWTFAQDKPWPLVAVLATLGGAGAGIAAACFERMRVDVEGGDFLLFSRWVGCRHRMYVRLSSALIHSVRIHAEHEAYDIKWRSHLVRNDGFPDIELSLPCNYDGHLTGLALYRHLALHGVLLECDAPSDLPHLQGEKDAARRAVEQAKLAGA